jgi:hypothetical protein
MSQQVVDLRVDRLCRFPMQTIFLLLERLHRPQFLILFLKVKPICEKNPCAKILILCQDLNPGLSILKSDVLPLN